jgi:hypothetical protein
MLDNYRDLIDDLLGTPTAIRGALPVEGIAAAPPDVVALVAELRDRDLAAHGRVQTMLRQRDAYLKAIGAAPHFGAELAGTPADPDAVLAGFDTARGDLVSLLMNLTLKDWERTAIDETEGEITLADEVERHVEFDEDHLARIRAALSA